MALSKIKFAIIGAGSISFSPSTISDILLNERIHSVPLAISLMDIDEKALRVSEKFAREAIKLSKREAELTATINLEEALENADFVIVAIEVNRYYYWSMDFHIPKRYGFRQIYGENGGPGGMFHTLRNLPAILHIARTMEKICPEAWLINYTNPEAKLVEAVAKLTKVKVVGLCHGQESGRAQLAQILEIPKEDLSTDVVGLNHFGWFTRIEHRKTGEDLYPLLREKEMRMDWLARWDDFALPRLFLRTYGLFAYPGTNHTGEYIAWSDALLASERLQYFFDPVRSDPWNGGKVPEFVGSLATNPTDRPLYKDTPDNDAGEADFRRRFTVAEGKLVESNEYGIRIAESIAFDAPCEIGAVNMPNKGYAPNLPEGMVIELPAYVDGSGIHPKQTPPLPIAIASMIQTQGTIHQLLIEAYQEQSRGKLLQAVLLDPTVSNYHNAVAMIDEMCVRQAELLPPMHW